MSHVFMGTNTVHLFLVEDDDGDAKAVRRAFQKAKIANPIVRALDGVEALEMLRQQNGKVAVPSPFIMLVDINMPRMNGIELITKIREDNDLKRMIIFVLTTSKNEEDKIRAYNLNVAGYIVKETAGQDFLGLVDLVGSYWRVVELPE